MILMIFMADDVRLKALVMELAISKIPQVEAMIQTIYERNLHWYIYLTMGLIL